MFDTGGDVAGIDPVPNSSFIADWIATFDEFVIASSSHVSSLCRIGEFRMSSGAESAAQRAAMPGPTVLCAVVLWFHLRNALPEWLFGHLSLGFIVAGRQKSSLLRLPNDQGLLCWKTKKEPESQIGSFSLD